LRTSPTVPEGPVGLQIRMGEELGEMEPIRWHKT